jgi:hypothetical protein
VLSSDQKREFAFGWLTWFGAECIAVAAAMLNLLFVPFVAFDVVGRVIEAVTLASKEPVSRDVLARVLILQRSADLVSDCSRIWLAASLFT